MAGYVYFTEEQKQRANQVDLEDFLSDRERNCCAPAGRSVCPAITASLYEGTAGMTMPRKKADIRLTL